MSRNDFVLASPERFGVVRRHQVAAGALTSIKAGELVVKTLGASTVALAATSTPAVGTDSVVGIATSDSTDTVAAAGTVDVCEVDSRDVWQIAPLVAATWNTQTKYNALVGDRELIDLTSGVFTLVSGDSALNGLVVQPLNDINLYPGKVLVSFKNAVSYLA